MASSLINSYVYYGKNDSIAKVLSYEMSSASYMMLLIERQNGVDLLKKVKNAYKTKGGWNDLV